jgi:translation elongation factor EF-1alpha
MLLSLTLQARLETAHTRIDDQNSKVCLTGTSDHVRAFALAWVLDQGSEERARGVTIDIATNQFETDKTALAP